MSVNLTWQRIKMAVIPLLLMLVAFGYLVVDGLMLRSGQAITYALPTDRSARSLLDFMRKLDGSLKVSNSFFESSNLKEVSQAIEQAHVQLRLNVNTLTEGERREADYYRLRYQAAGILRGLVESSEPVLNQLLSDTRNFLSSAPRITTREYEVVQVAVMLLDGMGWFDREREFTSWMRDELAKHTDSSSSSTTAMRQLTETLDAVVRRLEILGQPMDLKSYTLDGQAFDLESLRGKVTLLEFWGTRCVPCLEEIPALKRIYAAHKANGFEIVGVCLHATPTRIKNSIAEHHVPWLQLCHEEGNADECNQALMDRFGVLGVPTTILIDADGRVVTMGVRPLADGDRDLEKWLKKLVSGKR